MKDGEPKVVLCENHLAKPDDMDRTLVHEMIHAFDMCRAKVNFRNGAHHACTEVKIQDSDIIVP